MYHYTESGLQNVWLANGYQQRNIRGEKVVSIIDAEGLHRVIGRSIARKPALTGGELRFLRKELDLSQGRLGTILGASEESVSLWERRGRVPKSAGRLLQALYLEKVNGNVQVGQLIAELADLDRVANERLVFEDTSAGWREAA